MKRTLALMLTVLALSACSRNDTQYSRTQPATPPPPAASAQTGTTAEANAPANANPNDSAAQNVAQAPGSSRRPTTGNSSDLSATEQSQEMPKRGQANDHSEPQTKR
jgi:hypothetical protein